MEGLEVEEIWFRGKEERRLRGRGEKVEREGRRLRGRGEKVER